MMQRSGPESQVQVAPPGCAMAVYRKIAAPPSLTGVDHAMVALVLPAVALTSVGRPGNAWSVIDDDGALAVPVPASFVAVTVKVYGVDVTSPLTVHSSGPLVHSHVCPPPPEAVTVYRVIVAPPSEPGAAQRTTAWPLPAVADTLVGMPGVVRGVDAADASLADPGPAPFVAITVNVYGVPLARPKTEQRSGPLVHTHCGPPGLAVAV